MKIKTPAFKSAASLPPLQLYHISSRLPLSEIEGGFWFGPTAAHKIRFLLLTRLPDCDRYVRPIGFIDFHVKDVNWYRQVNPPPPRVGVDGTGPPTGDRPRRWTAAGWRRAKSGEWTTARSVLDKGTDWQQPLLDTARAQACWFALIRLSIRIMAVRIHCGRTASAPPDGAADAGAAARARAARRLSGCHGDGAGWGRRGRRARATLGGSANSEAGTDSELQHETRIVSERKLEQIP